MAIVPVVLRRRLLARANFGGGALVNLLAFAVQPAAYLKRMSIIRGIRGSSTVWTLVAVAMYGLPTLRRLFGKRVEVVDVSRLGADRFMHVTTATPMTRRRRRKLSKRGVEVPSLKEQKAYSRRWAAEADAAKRAS